MQITFGTQLKTSIWPISDATRSKSELHLIVDRPRNKKTLAENKTSHFGRVIINRNTKGVVIVDSCLYLCTSRNFFYSLCSSKSSCPQSCIVSAKPTKDTWSLCLYNLELTTKKDSSKGIAGEMVKIALPS